MEAESPLESERVRRHTAPEINARIDECIARNIRLYTGQPAEVINARLEELDREWDVERVLEANASTLALTGVVLGAAVDRRWLLLSAGVLGFLFMHSTQGWCPPLPALRRSGVRTKDEINRERFALKHLRGDFDSLGADGEHPEPERLAEMAAAN
ncbi:MAG: hypothetical protein C0518_03825 [Opitutus sp.]|nr:hypothetical protein [Opitutus sp.]